jgi:hypothetical protein
MSIGMIIGLAFSVIWTILLAPLMVRLFKQWGIDLDKEKLDMIRQLIEAGISYAEEQARIREKTDPSNRLTMQDKLAAAIGYIRQNDTHNLLREVPTEQLKGMIQSTLNQVRK